MSRGRSDKEIEELKQQLEIVQTEKNELQTQVTQYKTVCESQQTALNDKNALLEQFRQVNESLQADLEALKQLKPTNTAVPMQVDSSNNPWTGPESDGPEPEQYRILFVGGLSPETTEDELRTYFEQFGEVDKSTIKLYRDTGKSRGFGFIVYKKAAMIDNAQANRPHTLNDRKLDTKRTLPKDETDNADKLVRTCELFVGGISRETAEDDLKEYFEKFGKVLSVKMPIYSDTGKARGFAFMVFEDYDTVDKLVLVKHHTICGYRTEVKKGSKDKNNLPVGNTGTGGYGGPKRDGGFGKRGGWQGSGGGMKNQGGGQNNDGFNNSFNKRPRYGEYAGGQDNNMDSSTSPPFDMAMGNVDSSQARALAAYYAALASSPGNSQGAMGGGNFGNSGPQSGGGNYGNDGRSGFNQNRSQGSGPGSFGQNRSQGAGGGSFNQGSGSFNRGSQGQY